MHEDLSVSLSLSLSLTSLYLSLFQFLSRGVYPRIKVRFSESYANSLTWQSQSATRHTDEWKREPAPSSAIDTLIAHQAIEKLAAQLESSVSIEQ